MKASWPAPGPIDQQLITSVLFVPLSSVVCWAWCAVCRMRASWRRAGPPPAPLTSSWSRRPPTWSTPLTTSAWGWRPPSSRRARSVATHRSAMGRRVVLLCDSCKILVHNLLVSIECVFQKAASAKPTHGTIWVAKTYPAWQSTVLNTLKSLYKVMRS